jgi:hypothetical protein
MAISNSYVKLPEGILYTYNIHIHGSGNTTSMSRNEHRDHVRIGLWSVAHINHQNTAVLIISAYMTRFVGPPTIVCWLAAPHILSASHLPTAVGPIIQSP